MYMVFYMVILLRSAKITFSLILNQDSEESIAKQRHWNLVHRAWIATWVIEIFIKTTKWNQKDDWLLVSGGNPDISFILIQLARATWDIYDHLCGSKKCAVYFQVFHSYLWSVLVISNQEKISKRNLLIRDHKPELPMWPKTLSRTVFESQKTI